MLPRRVLWEVARGALNLGCRNQYLALVGDSSGWVLDYEAAQIARVMHTAGSAAYVSTRPWPHQAAFFLSRDLALRNLARWRRQGVAVCLPYYHGYPGQGDRRFDETYDRLCMGHDHVSRIQVTHPRMREVVLASGIAPNKVRTIPIGVDARVFVVPTKPQRDAVRQRLGIPESAIVVGSFQKDGNGWGAGAEPKRVKAPEILIAALRLLHAAVPELFVLLSGPARGFVKTGLDAAGIPYLHAAAANQADVSALFHALDAYIVASREEGGPKAILESMASGVPIISTRVGQAPELIRHADNGWLADVDDAESLARFALEAIRTVGPSSPVLAAARATAEANDYLSQMPLWMDFFDGLIAPSTGRAVR